MTDIATRYLAAWNQTEPAKRRQLIDELCTEDISYTDPLADVAGRDALDALIAGAQEQFAGLEFSVGGPVDEHHDIARFTWNLAAPGEAEPLVIGFDVVKIVDGKVSAVFGFLDKIPG